MQSRWMPAITITAGVLLAGCGPPASDVPPSPSPTTPAVTIPGSATVRPAPTPTSPAPPSAPPTNLPTPGRDDGLITDPAY